MRRKSHQPPQRNKNNVLAEDINDDVLSWRSSCHSIVSDTTTASSSSAYSNRTQDLEVQKIPETFQLVYLPLHWSIQFPILFGSSSAALLIGTTFLAESFQRISLCLIVLFFSVTIKLLVLCLLQEVQSPPTRLSTDELRKKNCLPSSLSVVETLQVCENNDDDGHDDHSETQQSRTAIMSQLDVHYLHYENPNTSADATRYDVIYCNHGLVASSLNFVPPFSMLTQKLRATRILAHDNVGFGFTERPPSSADDIRKYGFSYSADVGMSLLNKFLYSSQVTVSPPDERGQQQSSRRQKHVLLLGHSMGALTTLRMALRVPADIRLSLVLVAPAVLASHAPSPRAAAKSVKAVGEKRGWWNKMMNNVWTRGLDPSFLNVVFRRYVAPFVDRLRLVLLDHPTCFLLKRLFACPMFWWISLGIAWGNTVPLTDRVVERYRWPLVVEKYGWGVMNFLRAQLSGHGFLSYPGGDIQLLADVLNRSNVDSVTVLHGTKDRLVPIANTRRIRKLLGRQQDSKLQILELEGEGHCPLEASPDWFTDVIQDHLQRNGGR